MAIVFAENSEHGNSPALLLWDAITGNPYADPAIPIRGSYDINVGRGAPLADYMDLMAGGCIGATPTILYVHFWYKVVTAPSAGNADQVCEITAAGGNGGGTCGMSVDDAARLTMGVPFQLVLNRPVEVEIYWEVVPGTTTCHYAWWVNGTLIKAGDYTFPQTATYINRLRFGNYSAPIDKFNYEGHYDDIVVDTERRIGTGLTLLTQHSFSDDATEDQWTDNSGGATTYDNVDNIPLAAADYAVSARPTAATQRQLWQFEQPAVTGTVIAVDSLIAAQYEAAGTVVTAKHRISAPAGTAINTDLLGLLAATNKYFRTCRVLDCDGAAWTIATSDALRIGGEATKDSSGNERAMRITDAWKTVVYRDVPKDWAGVI